MKLLHQFKRIQALINVLVMINKVITVDHAFIFTLNQYYHCDNYVHCDVAIAGASEPRVHLSQCNDAVQDERFSEPV